MAALSATLISGQCFHNRAGQAGVDPTSPRGPWCDALAGRDAWEAYLIGGSVAIGALIHLLPLPWVVRWALWGALAAAVLAAPLVMGALDYTDNPI